MAAFKTGEDIHARTAEEVFGVGPMLQTAEHRRAAKAINFGIVYGLSAFGLAQQLGIEKREAAQFIASYFERYQGVKKYLDGTLEETAEDTDITKTLVGRHSADTGDHFSAREFAKPGGARGAEYSAAGDGGGPY